MARLLIGLLAVLSLVAGAPYAALAMSYVMGTSSSTFVDFDNSQQTLTLGRNAPQPEWLPDIPGSFFVKASRWAPSARALDTGSRDILVHTDANEVQTFYTRELQQRGFNVIDEGIGTLNPGAAAALGIGRIIQAERASTGHELTMTIREPDGLILRPRLIQFAWTQLNQEQKDARAALRAKARGSRPPQ